MDMFLSHLKTYLSEEEIASLDSSLCSESKHAVLLNINKMTDDAFLKLFPHVVPHPIVKHSYIYDKSEYELGKNIYHELGCYYLQEPSAMCVSYLLSPKENETVLDMCAAPGGKSIQASFLMKNTGIIVSNDISNERCRDLLDNISRLGRSNVLITNNDFAFIYQNFVNSFDNIILDAPCSGSGMFRKDEKMRNDWSLNKVMKFSMVQMSLIEMAYSMLKPGGKLIYSTCSYSYEENEAVIKHLLASTDAFLLDINHPLFYSSKEKIGVHLLPNKFPGEGHYICLIQKPGESKITNQIITNRFIKNIPEAKDLNVVKFNDTYFGISNLINYKKLNIYQFGLKIGEQFKNGIQLSYAFSRYLKDYNNKLELSFNDASNYILGNQLNIANPYSGNLLLTYQSIPIDFAKTNGQVIKNHYPKYLRKKVTLM